MGFKSEADLVETALRSSGFRTFTSCRNPKCILIEARGLFGVPDLVLVNPTAHNKIDAVAFEMKLSDWKRALMQAFRYLAFADRAYVCMDRQFVHRALCRIDQFVNANVGLLSIDVDGLIELHFAPLSQKPYSSTKRANLLDIVQRAGCGEVPRRGKSDRSTEASRVPPCSRVPSFRDSRFCARITHPLHQLRRGHGAFVWDTISSSEVRRCSRQLGHADQMFGARTERENESFLRRTPILLRNPRPAALIN